MAVKCSAKFEFGALDSALGSRAKKQCELWCKKNPSLLFFKIRSWQILRWESDLITAPRFNSQIYIFSIYNSLLRSGMCEAVYNSASNQICILMQNFALYCMCELIHAEICIHKCKLTPKESLQKKLQNLHIYAECGCRGVKNYANSCRFLCTNANCCKVMQNSAFKSDNICRILHPHVPTNP